MAARASRIDALSQSFLFRDHAAALDRYLALLDEDQAQRSERFEHPDPSKRRLRVACNHCETPFCCNQRVDVELVEALVLFRHAAEHARPQLEEAIRRGHLLHSARPTAERGPPIAEDEAFFRRRVACPFLVKGRCSIYRVRPWSCRTHYMASNPLKCRDELQPSETYSMDPDPALLGELQKLAEDVRFFAQVESMAPSELSQVLHLIDGLLALPPWREPQRLDFATIGEQPAGG